MKNRLNVFQNVKSCPLCQEKIGNCRNYLSLVTEDEINNYCNSIVQILFIFNSTFSQHNTKNKNMLINRAL